jgi:hypothetical protein
VVFLWVTGQFDSEDEIISEHIIQQVENHEPDNSTEHTEL